ncbi:hypothetical protein N0V82_001649 [Gnomoniopsis sp. IMI 355080]|nr:hypothetical protein N0V82_001649 [Gnomoniopsis sp. IMI 355080]
MSLRVSYWPPARDKIDVADESIPAVSPYNLLWQLTSRLWTPLIKLLPKAYWEPWLDIMQPDWAYRYLRTPWARLGDSFLVVSPRQIILFTGSAPAIAQITSRREAFPKQTSNYRVLEIFGRNMLSSEGAEWKMHRKGVSASFNERNAAYIFRESVMQTQGMIDYWLGGEKGKAESSGTVETLEHDTMTLALNIIARVGFGLRLLWPGQRMPEDADARSRKYGDRKPSEGHSMTFADSLATVLEKIFLCLLVPHSLLRILPFQAAREASAARWNYEQYMQEFLRDKKAAAENDDEDDGVRGGMDIMGQLVRTKYGKQKKAAVGGSQQLSDQDIIGNCFVILVAGHETTANTLHFTLIELATNPAAQRALQADVDRLLGRESDPRGWSYEESINALMASNVAACMNEVLRLTPSVVDIPKEVQLAADQSLMLDGERHVLPKGMTIVLNTVGAHRNPRYWPAKGKEEASDLDEFVPERWFRPSLSAGKTEAAMEEGQQEEEEDYGGFKGPDTSAQLYRPVRGSFIPFSDGPRSCLGRRIAQVEMVAALAVLFQRYSVELAVDEDVEGLGDEERREVYEMARKQSRETMRKATSLLTLKLHGDLKVPIRLVRRGEEQFLGLVDV